MNGLIPSNEIIEQALRKTVPMYPTVAVRELVAHALIHQDFFIRGAGPTVEIFADRLEVTNPGAPLVGAADRQGHFAKVSDALWSNVFDKRAFDRASVEKAATSVAGVDLARLRGDMDGDCRGWVEREQGALGELGVNATPQVWINGRPIAGGYKPLEGLKPVLDEELARASERIAAGAPRDRYYADWVMKNGLTKVASN